MRNISEFNSGLKSLNTTVQQSLVHCKFRREFPGRKIHIAAPSCDTDVQRRWQCGKQDPQWCTFDCQNISTRSGLEDLVGTVTTKVHQTAVPGSGDFQFCDESDP